MEPFCGDKKLIGFGAGLAALATIEAAGFAPAYLVDARRELWGQTLAGIPIHDPARLFDEIAAGPQSLYVAVLAWATDAVRSIFAQLEAHGLEPELDFSDCSRWCYAPMADRLRARCGIEPRPELFERVRAACLASDVNNLSSIAGSWLIQQLLERQLGDGGDPVEGDVAEAGVYQGGSALIALRLAGEALRGRRYRLFDSFEGLQELSGADPVSRRGELDDAVAGEVRDRFAHFEAAELHAGRFAQTLPRVRDHRYAMAYLDCDLYEPTRECIDHFYPRLSAGGVLLVHDYVIERPGLPAASPAPFTGVLRALDELARAEGLEVIAFPETTHALVRSAC